MGLGLGLGAGLHGCERCSDGISRDAPYERRSRRASLTLHAGLWQLAGVLERTDAAGTCETRSLKAGKSREWLLNAPVVAI